MYGVQAFGIVADPADPSWYASARRIETAIRGELDAIGLKHVDVMLTSTIQPNRSPHCYIGHASWAPFLTQVHSQYPHHAWVIVSGGFQPVFDEHIRYYFGMSRRRIIAFPNADGGEDHFRPWIRRWATLGLLPLAISLTEMSLVSGRQNVRQYVAAKVVEALSALMMLAAGADEALRLRAEAGLPLDEETVEEICTVLGDGIHEIALEKEIHTIGTLFRSDGSAAATRLALACRFIGTHHPSFVIRGESLDKLLKVVRDADDQALHPAVRSMSTHLRDVIDVFAGVERGDPEYEACFVTPAQAAMELARGPFPSEYGRRIVRDLVADALPGYSRELWVEEAMERSSLTDWEWQRVAGDLRLLGFLAETRLLPWRRSEAGHDNLSSHRFAIDGFLELALVEGDEASRSALPSYGPVIVDDAARIESFICDVLESFGFELSESLSQKIADARQAMRELRDLGSRLAAGEVTEELRNAFVRTTEAGIAMLDATSPPRITGSIPGIDSGLLHRQARTVIDRAFSDGRSAG